MFSGFVRVAAGTPKIRVADVKYNTKKICEQIDEATKKQAKILVLPELCITGATCGDLFVQDTLLEGAKSALVAIAEYTTNKEILVFVGLPLSVEGKLYNVTAAVNHGMVLGFIPKLFLPNQGASGGARQFNKGPGTAREILFQGKYVPFGSGLLFQGLSKDCTGEEVIVSAEIGTDVQAPTPPSTKAALAGAMIIVNCAAISESIGKDRLLRNTITSLSERLDIGYVFANAGIGESTTDAVFAGGNLIAEKGEILAEGVKYESGIIYQEIDVQRLRSERRQNPFIQGLESERKAISFEMGHSDLTELSREIKKSPFIPSCIVERNKRWEEILAIQTTGLVKRLAHTKANTAVLGVSGGLDSTLALLVTVKSFEILKKDKKEIVAVTMPCFGTTRRTYQNALLMAGKLGVTFREIPIEKAVLQHFADIDHDPREHNAVYENAQARERTQVLMEIANQTNGLVIGTGDLSELALGWATYNGDHISMYGVNAGVPKTVVGPLVEYVASKMEEEELQKILLDIVATPISPELLPPTDDGVILQKTEDAVGPYELHDFFLYYALRFHFSPKKIYQLATHAFAGEYDKELVLKWLEVFYCRFFTQQFKRSCMPDGPKIGSVSLSPRGAWEMPSDACVALWQEEINSVMRGI